ncbi:MAG: ABC transporter ATP-binding protein [Proteobacteria bacterium]|nr:ABC transporter ATP-binding protein [Pseudomonadota bacterium]
MQQPLPSTITHFIWHFLRPYKMPVIIFILLSISAGFWGPFNSILIKNLIDLLPQTVSAGTEILLWPALLIPLNFWVFDNFTWRGIGYIQYMYGGAIKNNITQQLCAYILKHPYQYFQSKLSGATAKQISTLADNMVSILFNVAPNAIRGVSLLLASFISAYYVNPVFCFILIVWFMLFAGFSFVMSKNLMRLSGELAKTEAELSGQLVDITANQYSIATFANHDYEMSYLSQFLARVLGAFRQETRFMLLMHLGQGALIAIMMIFATLALVSLYARGLVSVGDFALILGLAMNLGHMMWWTMTFMDEFHRAYGKCKQSLSSLIVQQDIQDKPDAKALKAFAGQIIFDDVTFHYKGSEPLFQNKSVVIELGQKVGLVGYSGSGKSTFVSLILRLYDVTGGAIMIDGQDIRAVTQDSLRSNIGIIPQDPSLFHRTLMENIRYGRIEASDAEIIEAAKRAHAHEFITELPEGYESLVGERGVKLSGGQRQRIAIARAILKNAPILILDEATSQLDSLTEKYIQDSLWELMQGKTTIVIAHRLSTLLHMDRILVFDKGKIIEDGTHQQLLSSGGLYKTMWDAQVGGFLPEEEA